MFLNCCKKSGTYQISPESTADSSIPTPESIQNKGSVSQDTSIQDTSTKRAAEETQNPQTNPRGLENNGNTCYFNSVLQVLIHTPVLSELLKNIPSKDEKLTKSFTDFCNKEWNRNPNRIHNLLIAKTGNFAQGAQHDAHECLRHFLDVLRKEQRSLESTEKALTVVDEIFGGHLMTVYRCQTCGMPYHLCEPMLDISLPMFLNDESPDKTTGTRETWHLEEHDDYVKAVDSILTTLAPSVNSENSSLAIENYLKYYTRNEYIKGEYLCNNCTEEESKDPVFKSATKRSLIFNPPAVLTIHLKRFEIRGRKFVKRNDFVDYEELLDLAPYCSSWCRRNITNSQNIWYSLYALVVHRGSLKSGHYTAYVKLRDHDSQIEDFLQKEYFDRDVTSDWLIKESTNITKPKEETKLNPLKGKWYCMNDNTVSSVDIQEVKKEKVFLLFYERIKCLDANV